MDHEKVFAIREVISLDKFIHDRRHNASDRYQATKRRDNLVEKYNILSGEVSEFKDRRGFQHV